MANWVSESSAAPKILSWILLVEVIVGVVVYVRWRRPNTDGRRMVFASILLICMAALMLNLLNGYLHPYRDLRPVLALLGGAFATAGLLVMARSQVSQFMAARRLKAAMAAKRQELERQFPSQ